MDREGDACALWMWTVEVWSVMVKSVQWQLVEDGVSKPRLCFGEMSRAQAGVASVASRVQAQMQMGRVCHTYMSSKAIKEGVEYTGAEQKASLARVSSIDRDLGGVRGVGVEVAPSAGCVIKGSGRG